MPEIGAPVLVLLNSVMAFPKSLLAVSEEVLCDRCGILSREPVSRTARVQKSSDWDWGGGKRQVGGWLRCSSCRRSGSPGSLRTAGSTSTEMEGNGRAPSQLCPATGGSQDPTVPKRGRSALLCLVCPGRIPVPPGLTFSLFQTHLLNRTSLFVLPGISTGLLSVSPDPHVKSWDSRVLGVLLLALSHLSSLCLHFPGD